MYDVMRIAVEIIFIINVVLVFFGGLLYNKLNSETCIDPIQTDRHLVCLSDY